MTALHSSVSAEDRQNAIKMAICSFDHAVQTIHDAEIEAGADIALTKHLAFLEFKLGFRREPITADVNAINREIAQACQALEMVFRASSEKVAKSFNRVGTELLHILVTLVDAEVKVRFEAITSPLSSPESRPLDGSGRSTEPDMIDESRSVTPPPDGTLSGIGSADRDLLLRKATKILGHFARVGEATKPIAHFPGLLGSCLNLINLRPYEAVPWEARLSFLWVIANLACNTDNMQMMMCTPGLINTLIGIGCRPLQSYEYVEQVVDVMRSRSIASRALLNLSWPSENKIPMAENMALVDVLCQLAVQRNFPFNNSRTIQNVMLQTRRHAVGAIRNLAAAPRRCKIGLCEYDNGRVLNVLTDAALNDSDQGVKDLSFAAIHNLAVQDTAHLIIGRPALVLALKTVLIAEEEEAEHETNTPRSHASSTLLVLERSITPEMNSYENLRSLLDAVNPTETTPTEPSNCETNSVQDNLDAVEGDDDDDDDLKPVAV